MKNIVLIPHIKIHNANAISSPYTVGFPAMTAWMGAVHALQRHLKAPSFDDDYEALVFKSVAVVCHKIDLQTHRGEGDYVHSIISTGNPLVEDKKRKKGGAWSQFVKPPFIEEARCHLEVSLLLECDDPEGDVDYESLIDVVDHLVRGKMRFAGGVVLESQDSVMYEVHDEASLKPLLGKLMPGHTLIERRDLMQASMQEGQDAIDALLDGLKVTHRCEQDEKGKINWRSSRKEKGWIVPIATGFHGITKLGTAQNQRDPLTPHRFAESVVTLGEFVMPYRITDLDQMLWHYQVDLENNLYLCQQNRPKSGI